MACNRGAVLMRLRVLSLRLSRLEVISVVGPRECFGGVRVTLFRNVLVGSMLELQLVGNPRVYVYSIPLSNLEQLLE